MKIVDIFAPYLFAFWFDGQPKDEYNLAISNWLDTEYLKEFYENNYDAFIKNNDYFPQKDLVGLSTFIINIANAFDNKLINSANDGNISDHFEMLSKGKDLYEILPKRKSKQQVLRFYGIQLESVIIIAGSAIKVTDEMKNHPLTAQQLRKINALQDFLRDNSITDEETFFDYLLEQNE